MTIPLSGIIPALATPFDDRGALAVDRIRENIGRYNRLGLSGYLANGSTGESVLLDPAEFERSLAPASFQLMTGSSSTIYPTMLMGGRGAILALATFLPEICIEIYKAAAAGDSAKALEIQRRVIQPTQKIVGARGISGVKYAMDCRGYYGGPARRPLLPLPESEKKDIESLLAAFAPAVAAN